jgi:hypothetical protein
MQLEFFHACSLSRHIQKGSGGDSAFCPVCPGMVFSLLMVTRRVCFRSALQHAFTAWALGARSHFVTLLFHLFSEVLGPFHDSFVTAPRNVMLVPSLLFMRNFVRSTENNSLNVVYLSLAFLLDSKRRKFTFNIVIFTLFYLF